MSTTEREKYLVWTCPLVRRPFSGYKRKHRLTAYMKYCDLMRTRVIEEHPEMKFGDIGQELGRRYAAEREHGTSLYLYLAHETMMETLAYESEGVFRPPFKTAETRHVFRLLDLAFQSVRDRMRYIRILNERNLISATNYFDISCSVDLLCKILRDLRHTLNFVAVQEHEIREASDFAFLGSGGKGKLLCDDVLDNFRIARNYWSSHHVMGREAVAAFLDHETRLLPELAQLCASYLPPTELFESTK